MTRPVPASAKALAKGFEKLRLVCYNTDGAHKPTIGYGHTRGLSPADVGVKTITESEADLLLDEDFALAAEELERELGPDAISAMTDGQWGALCDFTFNEGEMGPTLKSLLKARRFDAVPTELGKYVYAHVNGPDQPAVKLLGLVRRRNAEEELWASDEPGTLPDDQTPTSAALRDIPTPPAPSPTAAQPAKAHVTLASAAVTCVGACATAAGPVVHSVSAGLNQVGQAVAPYADASSHAAKVRDLALTAVAGLAVASLVLVWLQHWALTHESKGAPNNVAAAPKPPSPPDPPTPAEAGDPVAVAAVEPAKEAPPAEPAPVAAPEAPEPPPGAAVGSGVGS